MELENNQQIAIFDNPTFGSVRWVMRRGEPWFIANDVAKALGYSIPKDAIAQHCKCAELLKGGESAPFTGSPRGINIIPESDVYALIFKSNLPKAEDFRRWVCEEVLPSIRKTGKYALNQQFEGDRAYSFEKIQPLAMLDAIFSYVGLDNDEKAEVLDKIWEKNFGYSVLAADEGEKECREVANAEFDNSQIPYDEADLLSPSQIGKLLTPRRTGKRVNDLLCEIGLQYYKDGYYPTEKGKDFAIVTSQYAVNLRWKPSVINFIKNRAKQSYSGGDFCL